MVSNGKMCPGIDCGGYDGQGKTVATRKDNRNGGGRDFDQPARGLQFPGAPAHIATHRAHPHQRRRPITALLFIAIAGLLSGIALYSERENISQSDPSIAFCVGVGLLFLLLWLIVTKDTLVISVDGERFVAIAERLAAAEVDKFLYEYTALKASAFEGGKLKRESSASSLGDFTIN